MDPSSQQESHRLQRLLGLVAVLALAEWVFIVKPEAAGAQADAGSAPTVPALASPPAAPAAATAASAPVQFVTLR